GRSRCADDSVPTRSSLPAESGAATTRRRSGRTGTLLRRDGRAACPARGTPRPYHQHRGLPRSRRGQDVRRERQPSDEERNDSVAVASDIVQLLGNVSATLDPTIPPARAPQGAG